MITEDYVSFETAKLLKEKGFECEKKSISAMYNEFGVFHSLSTANYDYYDYEDFDKYDYIAPTLQMAMKWLREIHKLFIMILLLEKEEGNYGYTVEKIGSREFISTSGNISYDTTEDAVEAALKYVLENLI